MFADSLTRLLGDEPDIEIVATAYDAAEAYAIVEAKAVDLVVLDYYLPDGDGAAVTTRLRAIARNLRIVILTGLNRTDTARAAAAVHCDAFITKDRAARELVRAVRGVFANTHDTTGAPTPPQGR